MSTLGANSSLVDRLKKDFSLLDATLLKFELNGSNQNLSIIIEFQLMHSAGKILRLVCEDIIEFGFYYNNEHVFYNVERFKLIDESDYIYLSLDPDESKHCISDNDQDFIKMKTLSGLLI